MMRLTLVPLHDVVLDGQQTISLSSEPWLELRFHRAWPGRRWIKLTYRTSYLDRLVRPMIRFETADDVEIVNMTAGLFGKASWIGRIPENCQRISICPVDRPGPFAFEIIGCERVFRGNLLPRAWLRSPKTTSMAIGARFINARKETRQALGFARAGIPFGKFDAWKKRNLRAFDAAGLEAPRISPDRLPSVHVIVATSESPTPHGLPPLHVSLEAQTLVSWSCQHDDPDSGSAAVPLHTALEGVPDSALVCRLSAEDTLEPHALYMLAHEAALAPGAQVFYGDEVVRKNGCNKPLLKPDWSPVLQSETNYLGKAVFWRASGLRAGRDCSLHDFESGIDRTERLGQLAKNAIVHIRRILLNGPAADATRSSVSSPRSIESSEAKASIIIPTKDSFELISGVLSGVAATKDHQKYEVIIVDNGSTCPKTLDLYAEFSSRHGVQFVACPGKFNYSKMCNMGAAKATGDVLVFLNNDMSMPHTSWLAPLVRTALRPDVGAVGARLLFPSGNLQHGGVVVGMGGYADHVYHNTSPDTSGEFSRLLVPHEIGAVTGACLAVETRKFDQAGRFDESHLPVELNDIDLCLKLNELGYQSMMCPETELVHHQSASRGFSFRPFTRYAKERNFFRKAWVSALRDDPYFHPALSLFSVMPELDG